MKKPIFRIIALTLIFTHILTVSLRDVSFAQQPVASGKSVQPVASSNAVGQKTTSVSQKKSSAKESQQPQSASKPLPDKASSSSSAPGGGGSSGAGFNASILQSFQNDLFTGRAAFSLPISVPPGRKGIQPNIALVYTSNPANGILGVGWSLELGRIERSTKRGTPKYNSTDTFIFNSGSASVELTSIAAGEYSAKIEGAFMKFSFNGTSWTVTDKSGAKYYFGQSESGRQQKDLNHIYSWYLEKVVDVFGNSMLISYQADQNQLYPDKIEYTANQAASQSAKYCLEFILEARSDIFSNYRSGIKITTAKRLKEIRVKYNSGLVRKYLLAYQYGNSKRSLLSSVTQYAEDGVTALPPVTFRYQEKNFNFEPMTRWEGINSDPIGHDWATIRTVSGGIFTHVDIFDINGDGLPDRVIAPPNAPFDHWFVQLNNGHGFDPMARWEGINSDPIGHDWATIRTVSGGIFTHVDIFDINGDGLPDRVIAPSNPPFDHWFVQLNNGSGFDPMIRWEGINSDPIGHDWATIRTVSGGIYTHVDIFDINGDGLPDRVIAPPNPPFDHWFVQLNNGSGFDPMIRWEGINSDPIGHDWATIRTVGGGAYTYVDIVDINGDGLPDRVIAPPTVPTDPWYVQLNNGSGFDPMARWEGVSGGYIGHDWATIRTVGGGAYTYVEIFDINSDGLPDRVIAPPTVPTDPWNVQLNNGSSFEPMTRWEGISGGSIGHDWATIRTVGGYAYTYVDIFDINGDGLPDRAIAPPNAPFDHWFVQKGSDYYPDLLASVDNGIGGSMQITYTPSTQFDNTGDDGISDLPFPVEVVSSVTSSDGQGNSYTTSYSYKDGAFNFPEREFRGFGYVKVTDAEGNYTENYFKQDDIYKGKLYKQEIKDSAGNLYTKTENTWQYTQPYTAVYFPYLAQTDNYIYDGGASFKQTRVRFEYDTYGNPTKVISEGDVSASGDEKTQVTEYAYNTTDRILSTPKHAYLLDAAQNKVSEKRFYYDNAGSIDTAPANGLLTKEEVLVSNPITQECNNAIMQYAYDAYGNLTSVTDALGRAATTNYDTDLYIYPIKVTNALGHTVQSTYDYKTGSVLSTTDANNQTTTNVYDALGRLNKVIGPNDTQDYPGVIYEYDLSNTPIKVTKKVKYTDPLALNPYPYYTTYSFYDGLGRLIQTKSPTEGDPQNGSARQVISDTVKFDQRGKVKEKYLPYFVSESSDYATCGYSQPYASFTYDPVGRLIQANNPDGTYSTLNYSPQVITRTDENGHYKTEYYDAYGRVTRIEEHNATQTYTTTYAYDTQGNLTQLTDNQGNITKIYYDSLGRKLKMDDPDMGVWTYEYDAVGNLKKQTDAKGQALEFTYDALNRLTAKRYPLSANPAVEYFYDDASKNYCKGRLSKIIDQSGSTEFFYDNLGREIKSIKTVNTTSYTVNRAYDALDRLTALTYPDGEVVYYSYNNAGSLEKVYTQDAQHITHDYVSNIDYSATGQIIKIQYGNGAETNYTYNPQTLRLTNLTTQSSQGRVQDLNYQFDNVGNIKNITDGVNTATQSFTYDDLNRLIQAQGGYGVYNYAYDSIGNMTSKEGVNLTYGKLGKLPHAVTQYGSTSIDYDANGNMLKKGNLELTYDTENRLTKVEDTSNSAPISATLALQPGWNLVSFPVLPQDKSISSVLAPITGKFDQVSRYNSQAQAFEHYVGNSKYDQFTTFDYNTGYQIYVTSLTPVTLTVTGTYLESKTIQLKETWNFIGANHLSQPVTQALKDIAFSSLLRYNKDTGSFDSYPAFTEIEPGQAYYLKVASSQAWVITNSAPATTFTYDGDGGRVSKSLIANGISQSTTYIGSLFEKDSDGSLRKHIFAGPNRVCTLTQDAGHTTQEARYFHSDHLGSSNVITDSTGAQVAFTEFTPYGSTFRQTGSYDPHHKFTGKELDSSTGLYFYGARYYDPQLGRFISADTIVQSPYDPQSLNRYSYCRNNPINLVDPTGHWWFIVAAIIKFAVAHPIIFGAITGALTNTAFNASQIHNFGNFMSFAGIGAVSGGIFGGVSSGVGGIVGKGLGAFWGNLAGAAAGGLTGGFAGSFGNALYGGTNFGDALGFAGQTALLTAGISTVTAGATYGISKVVGAIRQANAQARAAGVKTPVGQQGQGSAAGSLNTNKGEAASGTQALSSRGTQSEPDVIHIRKPAAELEPIKAGEKVYRVWGDGAGAEGRSWTNVNPETVPNFRAGAGLPPQNTGRFVTEGRLIDTTGVITKPAESIYGNPGGLQEVVIPDPKNQVQIERVSGANPEY